MGCRPCRLSSTTSARARTNCSREWTTSLGTQSCSESKVNEANQVRREPKVCLVPLACLGHLLRRGPRALQAAMEPQVFQDPRAHQASKERQAPKDPQVHQGSKEQLASRDHKGRRAAQVTKGLLAPRETAVLKETRETRGSQEEKGTRA